MLDEPLGRSGLDDVELRADRRSRVASEEGGIVVEMPIVEQMYQILYQQKDPRQAGSDLMLRDLKAEAVRVSD